MRFYHFAQWLAGVILRIKGFKAEGLEQVPLTGPLIIACNHISFWDPVILGGTIPRTIHFMAKEELFRIPLLRTFVRWLKAFPVKRGEGDIQAFRRAIAVLKEGEALGIFPEGTRSKSGETQQALAGVALIIEKSKAPVLPIRVYGSKGLLLQKKGNIGIKIGKPFLATEIPIPEGVENRRLYMANQIMEIISNV